jgi:dienelactone hydrolase
MSVSDTCCSRDPFESDYTPKGAKVSVNGMDMYVVGDQNDVTLMGVYDIFGFHNNTLQFCDALSNAGFRVVVPDFFYGIDTYYCTNLSTFGTHLYHIFPQKLILFCR